MSTSSKYILIQIKYYLLKQNELYFILNVDFNLFKSWYLFIEILNLK